VEQRPNVVRIEIEPMSVAVRSLTTFRCVTMTPFGLPAEPAGVRQTVAPPPSPPPPPPPLPPSLPPPPPSPPPWRRARTAALSNGLVAYFVKRPERPATETELRAFLRGQTAGAHGSICLYRARCVSPHCQRQDRSRSTSGARRDVGPSPATYQESKPVEQIVIDVWRKALNLERV